MTRRARRVWALVVCPPWSGFITAAMAPLFRNDPAIMFPVGTALGLVLGVIWLAIAEA